MLDTGGLKKAACGMPFQEAKKLKICKEEKKKTEEIICHMSSIFTEYLNKDINESQRHYDDSKDGRAGKNNYQWVVTLCISKVK